MKTCNKRHKKPCKFKQSCIRIDSCEFLHDRKEKYNVNIPESTDNKNEAEDLTKVVLSLKAEIDLLKAKIDKQKEELKSIENDTCIKLDKLNNKVYQLEKENFDKDTLIKVLRGKLKGKEEQIEEQKVKVKNATQETFKMEKELNVLKEKANLKKLDVTKKDITISENSDSDLDSDFDTDTDSEEDSLELRRAKNADRKANNLELEALTAKLMIR